MEKTLKETCKVDYLVEFPKEDSKEESIPLTQLNANVENTLALYIGSGLNLKRKPIGEEVILQNSEVVAEKSKK